MYLEMYCFNYNNYSKYLYFAAGSSTSGHSHTSHFQVFRDN